MKVKRVSIETLYLGLYDGPHATPKPSESGPVFLGIGNLTDDGKFDLSDIRHIAEEDFPAWTRRVTPREGDIVFTYEATLNRYAVIPDGFRCCLGRRLALIRPNPQKVNPLFLFYYFFDEDWRQTISQNTLSGSTVDRIPITTFPTFEVNLPSRPTQDNIVSILCAYDQLIENNARRIKVLEEMTQRLYQEWFVNFRFSGYKNVKLKDSDLGPMPEGWCQAYPDHVDFLEGPGLRRWQYRESGLRFLNIRTIGNGDIDLSKAQFIDPAEAETKYRHFLLAEYDHVVSSSGTIGRIATVRQEHLPLMLNTSVIRMRPKGDCVGRWQLKQFLKSEYFQTQIRAFASGVAQMNFGPSHLKQMKIVAPPLKLGEKYEAIAGPIEELILNLTQKNFGLRTTRDLLLPKLFSGDISVEHLDAVAQGV